METANILSKILKKITGLFPVINEAIIINIISANNIDPKIFIKVTTCQYLIELVQNYYIEIAKSVSSWTC